MAEGTKAQCPTDHRTHMHFMGGLFWETIALPSLLLVGRKEKDWNP